MSRKSLAYFAPDATQGSVTKRIVSFQEHGLDVISFTFRRDRDSVLNPVCENIDLGVVPDRRYIYRAIKTLAVLGRLWNARDKLRTSPIYYARMLDSALIALLAKKFCNNNALLYYEICDIRKIMMDRGLAGRAARLLERLVLRNCDCVVVNSPAFLTEYFAPIQAYRGEAFVLENKVYASSLQAISEARAENLAQGRSGNDRLRVAWFGNLDCPETWATIQSTAAKYPEKISFYLRGYPIISEAEIRRAESALPNIEFGGPFNNRTDLTQMYSRVDAVLGLDLMNREGNSWWLLPNSLYEAGAYGRPLITSEGTQTASRVASGGTGWVLSEPVEASLAAFLDGFDWTHHARVARRVADAPVESFAGQGQVGELVEQMFSKIDRADPDAAVVAVSSTVADPAPAP